MKNSRVFEIAWQGLKLGEHELIFDLDDKFLMWKYPETEYKQLNVQIKVTFDKQVNFFMFHFNIDGSLVVPCDRCGEEFELSLWDEFDLLVKLNDVEDEDQIEEEADVVFISRSETVLDISDWLYEFLMLSIPLQKIHPQDAKGNDTCNPDVLAFLKKSAEALEQENKNTIWKGLDSIKIEDNKKSNKRSKN
ncbi:MAG: hypothetical protein RLZZ605_349 [Bacteroidota bacterium]|jgi:uncharacterized metal-binding protein YceD (DUF177 family)